MRTPFLTLRRFNNTLDAQPTGLSNWLGPNPFHTGNLPVPFFFSPKQNRWLKNTPTRICRNAAPLPNCFIG